MSRPYRGQAADARSAERRARLLQAAVELVGTHGVAAMTMRAVCREAELSQKFFYESFSDTDDLLREVYRSTFEHARRAINAAGDPATDLPSRTRAGVAAAAQLVKDDPRICRILLVEPIADLRLRQFVRDTIGAMTLGGLTIPTDGPGTAAPARVKMQYATVFGAIISLFIEWTEGNLGSDQEAFVEHVTTMLLSSPLVDSTRPRRR
ncbi:TetR/AcrR family transcriptional regulator [Mycolicibacterium neworleansense]|uniref:TetR family transcriptional regulator n=1 Tax=Mycolicibacterium neworleansense TaxID=146018 RepID=A0A0H5RSB4_9MYCO|nr:TetR/AcrR family transcriptional regulator [Mycolicibacterium neworleansense]MCV7361457.1 TetR/AcrR family transcriptional regulator [Mycolicibacterium neworleansense]CRZ16808.1 TetR family transcriptional regulator [Mycolicibacterium neworleansense]